MALLPAWPMVGETGSKWPARDDEALSDQPEARRQAIQAAAAPQHRAPTLFTHHEVGEALRKEERGEEEWGGWGGEGKDKRKKTKLESQMPGNLLLILEWKEWQGHPHVLRSMQEH